MDIIDAHNTQANPLWDTFMQTESYYLNNGFTYQLIAYKSSVLFKEYFNGTSINELEIESDSLEWYILKAGNEKVISYTELLEYIKNDVDENAIEVEIINSIEELKAEGLLYVADDYKEIVSIINTNILLI